MAEGGGEGQATGAISGTHDVFISYASQDAAVANAVVAALERHGLTCWIAPRDVTPGALYADEIIRSINGAKALVIVLSASAIASPHVGKEVERASSKQRPIITFKTDTAPLTNALEYFLSESQWVDVGADGSEAAFAKLITAVRRQLTAASTGEPGQQDGTAQPVSEPPRRPPESVRLTRRLSRPVVAIIAVIAAIGAYLVVDKLWLSKHVAQGKSAATVGPPATPAAPTIPEKSVAVLPFVDMSEKKDQEYFSDGLSDELIDHLAHSPDLKVIARTSSFQFKGKNEDMRTIGQKLGVANLLEGSVRTSGKTLRVTAQLIKVSDGSHLWSETYDRDMGDIFKMQDSIATSVVNALQATMAKFTPSSQVANTEAYNAFLRGEYLRKRGTKQDLERALAAYQEAIRLDPKYAAAWVGIAAAYNNRGLLGWMPQKDAYTEARKAVDHALSIDPNLARAHSALAGLEWNYLFDFEKARAETLRARALDPIEGAADELPGWDELISGRFDESVQYFRERAKRDPLSSERLASLIYALQSAGRLAEAESAARNLLDLNPSFASAHCNLGDVLLEEHMPDAALAIMNEEVDPDSRWCVTDALWALGRHTEADALLGEAKTKYADTQADSIAGSYALRNDKEEAFKWLYRAYDNRDAGVTLMRVDLSLRNLHGDPRFTALLRKMKLPE